MVVRTVMALPYGTFGIWIALGLLLNYRINRNSNTEEETVPLLQITGWAAEMPMCGFFRALPSLGRQKSGGTIPSYLTVLWPHTCGPILFAYFYNQTIFLQSWRKSVCKTRSRPLLKTQFAESHGACGVVRTLLVQSEL